MPSTNAILALAPVAGLACYCITQIVISRLSPRRSPYISLAIGFLLGLALNLAISTWAMYTSGYGIADAIAILALNALTSFALGFGYFNFVNLTLVSLRIRVMEELYESGGSRSRAVLLSEYGSNDVVGVRLQRLVRGKILVENAGVYTAPPSSFLRLARLFDLLREIILGTKHPVSPATQSTVGSTHP